LFEPLAVGAARAKHQNSWTGLRRTCAKGSDILPTPGCDQYKFFLEYGQDFQGRMSDWGGDKGAIERTVEHCLHECRSGTRLEAQLHGRETLVKAGK
jgi:hypothetical protein